MLVVYIKRYTTTVLIIYKSSKNTTYLHMLIHATVSVDILTYAYTCYSER